MNGADGGLCKFFLLVLVLVEYIVSGTSQFIQPSAATPRKGFSFLTARHYMQIMDMLFTERRLRRHLEQNVTRLQNKIDSLNLSNKNQMTGAGIAEYLKPLNERMKKQEQELVIFHQMYAKNLKDKNNEVIKLKERVTQLEQRPEHDTQSVATQKPAIVERNTSNGFDAQKLETIIKDMRHLKASDRAKSNYLFSLYKMTVTLKQDIAVISLELEKVFNDSVLEKKIEVMGKQFADLQQIVQNITKEPKNNQKDSVLEKKIEVMGKQFADLQQIVQNITKEPKNNQKDLIIGTGVTHLNSLINGLRSPPKTYNDSAITRRLNSLEYKITYLKNATLREFLNNNQRDLVVDKRIEKLENSTNFGKTINDSAITRRVGSLEDKIMYVKNATLREFQNDIQRDLAVDKRIEKLENSTNFGKTINGLTQRITNLEEFVLLLEQSLLSSSLQLNATILKVSALHNKTNTCKDEIKKMSTLQDTNTGNIHEIAKNISSLSTDKKRVGFTACGGTKLYDHIHFEEIKTSYGINMPISYRDGKFMARDDGYYFVTASVLSGSQGGFYIWKNKEPLTSAWFHYSGSSNGYHTASASVFVKMIPGDKISIRGSSTSNIDPASCLTILKI